MKGERAPMRSGGERVADRSGLYLMVAGKRELRTGLGG